MNNEKLKLEPKIKKYYQLIVVRQWKIVLICWLTLGIFSFWELRAEFKLWAEYFTWSAVRYALVYHRLSAICLSICIGLTLGLLIRQSKEILWGFSDQEKYRLQQEVDKIFEQGQTHPFYKFLE
jgi:hypothetical protein